MIKDINKLNTEHSTVLEYYDSKHIKCLCHICKKEYMTTASCLRHKSVHKECFMKLQKPAYNALTYEDVKQYNNEYSEIVEYINSRKVICKCLLCENLYQTKLDSIKNKSCHKSCRSKINKDIKIVKAKQKTKELQNKEYEFVDVIEYKSATDVIYKCKICGEIYHASIETINNGYIHRPCFSKFHKLQKQSHNDVVAKIFNKNPHLIVIGNYTGAKNNIRIKCNQCGFEWESNANELYSKIKYCPQCCMSYGEYRISQYLLFNNINFVTQKTFDGCEYHKKLRFDFYIPDYNICIEYQGKQHYVPVDFTSKLTETEKENVLKENIIRDNIKREYCNKNNIHLLEIKYTEFEYIEDILDEYFKNP